MVSASNSILFVGAFPETAALARYVSGDLALQLQAQGWRTSVTSRRVGRLARLCDIAATIWKSRLEYGIACVDVFSGAAFLWAEVACGLLRRLHKPYLLTLHGGNLPVFAARWPGRVRRLLGPANAVTAPSGYLKHHLAPYRDEIRVIPNSIDLRLYPFRQRGPLQPSLVWLRTFHEIYNPMLAIETVAALLARFPRLRLVMAGPERDGSLQQVQARVAALGLSERIRFPGPVPKEQVPALLSEADIFLNTTNIDNTPVSVIEAMACGLCVVTTRAGGIPFLCQDQRDSLLVEPNSARETARAVARALDDSSLANRLSAGARARAMEFDLPRVLAEWNRILHRLARSDREPVPQLANA